MGKRIIRIFGEDILGGAERLVGLDVNVILQTGDSYLGIFKGLNNDIIVLSDHRSHLHEFPVGEIESVIFDQSSSW